MKAALSQRIAELREILMKRGFQDRSKEWFVKKDLPDIAKFYPKEHVMVRRAYGVDAMLKAL